MPDLCERRFQAFPARLRAARGSEKYRGGLTKSGNRSVPTFSTDFLDICYFPQERPTKVGRVRGSFQDLMRKLGLDFDA
jgi:hypothetical protein